MVSPNHVEKFRFSLNGSPEKGETPISSHARVGNYHKVVPPSIIYAKLDSIFIIMTHPFSFNFRILFLFFIQQVLISYLFYTD